MNTAICISGIGRSIEYTFDNLKTNLVESFDDYDCFIACYPPAFSLLYEKFDKPIIAVAATRYEHPFSGDQDRWGWFNEKLIAMIDSGQITPVSNNKYDKAIMLADFYDDTWMPHALFYDSFTDIPEILSSVDLLAVSDSMREFNTTRKLTVTERWEDALSRL